MALELGPHNIRVNSVGPTVVMTEMGKLGWSDPQKAQNMISKIPLGRFAGTINSIYICRVPNFNFYTKISQNVQKIWKNISNKSCMV